jgi:hypothetical protein
VLSLSGQLWEAPESPHALDDEFESQTIDPAWSGFAGLSQATVDPYSVASPSILDVHKTNPSWLMCQGQVRMSKLVGTLPTNMLLWARMRHGRDMTDANGDHYMEIFFSASTGGTHDTTNDLKIRISAWNSGEHVTGDKQENGGFPQWAATSAYNGGVSTYGQALEYAFLHKIGLTYHGWCMTSGGNRIYCGNTTFLGAGTLDRVGFTLLGSGANPSTLVQGLDFFRVVEDADFIP